MEKNTEFVEKLVHINRITKVVKGGRRFGFSALVVVGNQNGKIGIAHAKAKQVPDAIKKAKMPEDAEKVALKELDRLTKIPTQSPEYTVSRTYLDWLTELPWSKTSEDSIDISESKAILDEDHYGLKKVKERILEYLLLGL